jgi:integrase
MTMVRPYHEIIVTSNLCIMTHYVMWPILGQMQESGFQHLAKIPFVIVGAKGYHREASWYLRDRALLAWAPGNIQRSGKYPTRKSLSTYSSSLVDFLDWCDSTSRDWRTVEYTSDLVLGYQEQMGTGLWSESGKPLSAQTINMRIGESMRFLQWGAARSLRKPFEAITVTQKISLPNHTNAGKPVQKEIEVRAGKVRPDPVTLRLPTRPEVARWLRVVQIEKGLTKALMCDLIIQTAIRREEACQWKVDTLPLNKADWNIKGDTVTVKIEYGAKGGKTTDNKGDERGPSRNITMPLSMAERLHHYRENIRPTIRSIFVKANSSTPAERRELAKANPRQLFLGDSSGLPIQNHTLYDAWTKLSYLPFKGWSPHCGRHYWACETLLEAIEKNAVALGSTLNAATSSNWITGCANDTVMLKIQPQLGHISQATTERYLQWVLQTSAQMDLNDGYQAALDEIILSSNG